MAMKRLLLLASLLLAFAVGAFAQMLPPDISMPEDMHSNTSAAVIDGAKNPELIPDATAYRLFFVTTADSATATDAEKVRHRAHLGGARLNDADTQTFVGLMQTFNAEYQTLIKTYNEEAKNAVASDQAPDIAAFLAKRDALVQGVRDKLKSTLTSAGLSNLDNFVQSEKQHMKIQ
jgi:hypothetical protein